VLRQLPPVTDPDLLVGTATGDDAGVYRLSDDLALVQTVDFFPPIVDDPFSFGSIAVANAVSDVYAMGGRPLLGMNIVAFPIDLPKEILVDILKGGAAKAVEAGLLVVGGHTIDDEEPKFGMAVTGLVRPGEQVTNAGASDGDVLVLTKPIGTGIITTAGKQQRADDDDLSDAVESMSQLNHKASHAMTEVGVNACVDVTGFGLIGHLLGMLQASEVSASLSFSATPLLAGARDLAEAGMVPGGTRRNLKSADRNIDWGPAEKSSQKLLLCDAQTSGGLLMSVHESKLAVLLEQLEANGVATRAVIGRIVGADTFGDRRIRVED